MQPIVARKHECFHCLAGKTYSTYFDKDYLIEFDNGTMMTNDGDTCNLKGTFRPLLRFGKGLHRDLEPTSVSKEIKEVFKIMEGVGLLVPKTDAWSDNLDTISGWFTSLVCPGVPLSQARWLALQNYVLFALDDILDNYLVNKRDKPFPYKNILTDLTMIGTYLEEADETKLPILSGTYTLPKLKEFCVIMRIFHKKAISYGLNPNYYFGFMKSYLVSCAVETSEPNFIPTMLEYVFTSSDIHGYSTVVGAIMLIRGIELTKSQWEEPMIKLLFYLGATHLGWVNDIMGVQKENRLGGNTAVFVAKKQCGNLQEAFDKCVNDCNLIAERIIDLEAKILNTYSDPMIRKFVEVIMNVLDGDLQYYINNQRYLSKDLVLRFV